MMDSAAEKATDIVSLIKVTRPNRRTPAHAWMSCVPVS